MNNLLSQYLRFTADVCLEFAPGKYKEKFPTEFKFLVTVPNYFTGELPNELKGLPRLEIQIIATWGTTFKHLIAEVHTTSKKRLSKIEASDDPSDGAGDELSPTFRWMRQRKSHPPFVVKIDAVHEIEQTQYVSVSTLLGWSQQQRITLASVYRRHKGCEGEKTTDGIVAGRGKRRS